MSENTKIEWATHTFNPWVGCTKISPACDHCYAEGWAKRSGQVVWGGERKRTSIANWKLPLKWNRQAQDSLDHWEESGAAMGGFKPPVRPKVFCASLADVFDNAAPVEWRMDLFELISNTPNLDWLILTKRIGNVMAMCSGDSLMFDLICERVWLGSTICNQEEADRDIPKLLAVPAHKRFLSMEPLLGRVDLCGPLGMWWNQTMGCFEGDGAEFNRNGYGGSTGIDWVIVGGESGPGARPMPPDWARSLRNTCQAAGVPFLFKQWGEWISTDQEPQPYGGPLSRWMWVDGSVYLADDGQRGMPLFCKVGKKVAGRLLDGREWNGVPA